MNATERRRWAEEVALRIRERDEARKDAEDAHRCWLNERTRAAIAEKKVERLAEINERACAAALKLVEALREVDDIIEKIHAARPHLKLAYARAVIRGALDQAPAPVSP